MSGGVPCRGGPAAAVGSAEATVAVGPEVLAPDVLAELEACPAGRVGVGLGIGLALTAGGALVAPGLAVPDDEQATNMISVIRTATGMAERCLIVAGLPLSSVWILVWLLSFTEAPPGEESWFLKMTLNSLRPVDYWQRAPGLWVFRGWSRRRWRQSLFSKSTLVGRRDGPAAFKCDYTPKGRPIAIGFCDRAWGGEAQRSERSPAP